MIGLAPGPWFDFMVDGRGWRYVEPLTFLRPGTEVLGLRFVIETSSNLLPYVWPEHVRVVDPLGVRLDCRARREFAVRRLQPGVFGFEIGGHRFGGLRVERGVRAEMSFLPMEFDVDSPRWGRWSLRLKRPQRWRARWAALVVRRPSVHGVVWHSTRAP